MEALAAACGGKKVFAAMLRPDLEAEPDRAHRWFLDALNHDRRTEFHAEHLRRACRIGREHDCHILKHWLDDSTGYQRSAIAPARTPQQELAAKMRQLADQYGRLADEHAAIENAQTMAEIRKLR